MKSTISQRVTAFFIYLPLTYFSFVLITKIWWPSDTLLITWLTSSIAYYLYNFFITFFYVKPQDSLATAITSLLVLSTLILAKGSSTTFLWFLGLSISVGVTILSVINLALKKENRDNFLNRLTYKACQFFGNGELIFFPVLMFCTTGVFNIPTIKNPIESFILLNSIWLFFVFAHPVEFIISLFESDMKEKSFVEGHILRIDFPNIIRVHLSEDTEWKNNYLAKLNKKEWIRVFPLKKEYQDNGFIGTGYFCDCKIEDETFGRKRNSGEVFSSPDNMKINDIFEQIPEQATFAGIVIENSKIAQIKVEILSDVKLEEGYLLVISIRGEQVYYQISEGVTDEESISSNPKGKTIAYANQLGTYTTDKRFQKYSWVPEMNTAVFVVEGVNVNNYDLKENEIGLIPNSKFPVQINYDELVKYHCAILGKTGSGKTELAFDIITHNVNSGIKVICVDITGDYMNRLTALNPIELCLSDEQVSNINELIERAETGDYGGAKEKGAFYSYLDSIRDDTYEQVNDFLTKEKQLAIIQLIDIANTRATLRITEEYLSAIFNWAKQPHDKVIQIVLEEAHTIIPEYNYFKYDKVDSDSVVGRMAQIALQGRKYRVGIMLVSQRTALVSKTVLTQCGTFFNFNLIDKTSFEFLSNVFGDDMIQSIRNLKFLQFVAYGKAINSDNPVIVEIQFDDKKLQASKFREVALPKKDEKEDDKGAF